MGKSNSAHARGTCEASGVLAFRGALRDGIGMGRAVKASVFFVLAGLLGGAAVWAALLAISIWADVFIPIERALQLIMLAALFAGCIAGAWALWRRPRHVSEKLRRIAS